MNLGLFAWTYVSGLICGGVAGAFWAYYRGYTHGYGKCLTDERLGMIMEELTLATQEHRGYVGVPHRVSS